MSLGVVVLTFGRGVVMGVFEEGMKWIRYPSRINGAATDKDINSSFLLCPLNSLSGVCCVSDF